MKITSKIGSLPLIIFSLSALILSRCGTQSTKNLAPTPKAGIDGAGTGKAGSLSRFALVSDHLYALSGTTLRILSLQDPTMRLIPYGVYVGSDAETIFASGSSLFVGSQTGMSIYDTTDPKNPRGLGALTHARSCDPVVVHGQLAYLTLRGGGQFCSGQNNQMDIIDITDLKRPKLIKTYLMEGPAGLGIDGTQLFICDGSAGLKLYDVTDPLNVMLLEQIPDEHCLDVIPSVGLLVVSGKNGIRQYQYPPLQKISEIH